MEGPNKFPHIFKLIYQLCTVLILLIFFYLIFPSLNKNFMEISTMSILPLNYPRDSKGKFISESKPLYSISSLVFDAIVGELLGDGSLQFNTKDQEGKPKPNTNAYLYITLK
jgi:hypothetical protein